jgi:hypothetical protein
LLRSAPFAACARFAAAAASSSSSSLGRCLLPGPARPLPGPARPLPELPLGRPERPPPGPCQGHWAPDGRMQRRTHSRHRTSKQTQLSGQWFIDEANKKDANTTNGACLIMMATSAIMGQIYGTELWHTLYGLQCSDLLYEVHRSHRWKVLWNYRNGVPWHPLS